MRKNVDDDGDVHAHYTRRFIESVVEKSVHLCVLIQQLTTVMHLLRRTTTVPLRANADHRGM